MNYTSVNINEWSRGSLFQFYIDKMRIVMSLTVDVDVTNLKAYSKAHHLDFYPLMVWVVSKIINAHDGSYCIKGGLRYLLHYIG